MTFQQILKTIRDKNLSPVYFLHGKEPFYIDELAKHFEQDALSESEKAFNQTILYGREVDPKKVLDHVRQFPVMAEKQLVLLREAASMKDLGSLEGYIKTPNPHCVFVIVHRNKLMDKRTSFYKSLAKHAVVFESKELKEKDLPSWISEYVKAKGFRIEPVAIDMLVELIGANLGNLSNELDKLVIGMEKGSAVSKDQVLAEIGMSKEYNVFELQSALATGNVFRVHQITRFFMANIREFPVQMLIAVLYNFYSKLYIAAAAPNQSDNQMAQKLGYSSAWFIRDYKAAVKRYSYEDVERCLTILHQYDLKSKGMGARNPGQQALMIELIDHLIFVRHGAGV